MKRYLKYIFIFTFIISMYSCQNVDSDTTEPSTITTEEITTGNQTESCSYNIDIQISNDLEMIDTLFVMCSAYGTDNGNQFTADGFCQIYNIEENIENFSTINESLSLEIIKDNSVHISSIEVYDFDGFLVETWDTWDYSSDLAPGEYVIKLYTRNEESNCVVEGHNYFVLNVD